MRCAAVIALFLAMISASGAKASEAAVALSAQDQLIFNATLQKCAPGTVGSALRLAFDKDNFISGLSNWLNIMGMDLKASETRTQSGGMSPAVAQARRSPGFWLAMTECYGYKYGELNYGNLMKQIVDMGHLTTESASTLAGLAITSTGLKLGSQALQKFPIATRFIAASLLSLQVNSLVNIIAEVYYPQLTKQDVENLNKIKSQIFQEPDQAIASIDQQATLAVQKISIRLQNPDLSQEERTKLETKKKAIEESLENLRRLKNE
ncbi:MAG: hypothetical protein HUU57_12070 [Bdellovibrio sp.]|nr:hypothetical protein [Bdellovibrio sp.]